MSDIYLIRHAESEVNLLDDIIGGRSNWATLTENGKAQATSLGERYLEEKIKFKAIISSPAVRTQQTARYCLKAMKNDYFPVKLDNRLMEIYQGDWEGKSRKLIYAREDILEGWRIDNWSYIPGDEIKGESLEMVALRMRNQLEETIKRYNPEDNIIFITHGLAIKCLLKDIFGWDKKVAYKIPLDNTAVTILKYNHQGVIGNEKPLLTVINDTSHLDTANLPIVKGIYDDDKLGSSLAKR